ncbi:23S rRNA pseudouridine955/2504/2580 synthase [Butyrivibrio sp. INlla18]|uniref:RluA family pseudouridine synthase n=1 Tax=Butyrivibrio sp. INlla18 TaxID=1520806 RepID=UPI00088F9A91|nr:RluA family pseudouridine synthase [Butyrivibrio sp. INlla18]SDA64866.1 23S rRNA pseudouridine955/2504/2580 synthase [Butyrivibrio sp. INlla18]
MKEIIIDNNQLDKRLDSFLKGYLPNASGGFIYKMLRKKNITLNDKKAQGTEKLKLGDSVKLFFADETLEKFMGKESKAPEAKASFDYKKLGVEVIYEDSHIVLLSKPAGLLTQKAQPQDISLNDYLIEYLCDTGAITKETLETYRPSVCNRLDRNTSGLVICAKSLAGARCMNSLLKDRNLDKYYRTIVEGKLSDSFTLKGYLTKDEKKNKVEITSEPINSDSDYIETEYEPLEYLSDRNLTVLEVKLITGKPHQIRAHLSSIGHPIIGDIKYDGHKIAGLNYQLLHSYRIKFPNDLPEDFMYLAGKEYISKLPTVFEKVLGKG